MKVTYDPQVDVLRILFRDVPVEESDQEARIDEDHFFSSRP